MTQFPARPESAVWWHRCWPVRAKGVRYASIGAHVE
eukprot:COSAG06_NODE_69486_length_197_cov_57.040816_1_plen_35_part_10